MNGMYAIRIKEILDCTGNTVYLCKGSDTEKTNTNAKERKDLCKPFPVLSHTPFYVIERTADDMSILCYYAVFRG